MNVDSVEVKIKSTDGQTRKFTQPINDIKNWKTFRYSLTNIQKVVNAELTSILKENCHGTNCMDVEEKTDEDTDEDDTEKYAHYEKCNKKLKTV